MLKKIISGFQDGADIAGIVFGSTHGFQTGGTIPNGYKTLSGSKPEYASSFGAIEHASPYYPPRTEDNVRNSDGTARFAFDFKSAGEVCTLKFIRQQRKPYIDIPLLQLNHSTIEKYLEEFQKFLVDNKIETLNVAGNSPKTNSSTYDFTLAFLKKWYTKYYEH